MFMVSEAQKKAMEKYRRKAVRQYTLRFTHVDQPIIDKLDNVENKTDYIRKLIKKDLNLT